MTKQYEKCPKCNYAPPDKSQLGEICGSCGLVFSKYEKHQAAASKINEKIARGAAASPASPSNGEEDTQNTERPSHQTLRKYATWLFGSMVIVGLAGYFIFSIYLSPEAEVLRTWSKYNDSVSADSLGTSNTNSYDFLTPYSQAQISRSEWAARFSKRDPRYRDEVVLTTLSGDNNKAILSTNILDENGDVASKYMQTWIKSNGMWRRAWAEDNSTTTNVAANAALDVNKASQSEVSSSEQAKSLIKTIVVESISTTWEAKSSALSSEFLYRPTTRVKILNTGDPISELRMMVRYFDKTRNELFDEDEEYVVTERDVPMGSNERRTLIFTSSKGFEVDLGNISSTDVAAYKRLARKYRAELYVKGSYNDTWKKYSE